MWKPQGKKLTSLKEKGVLQAAGHQTQAATPALPWVSQGQLITFFCSGLRGYGLTKEDRPGMKAWKELADFGETMVKRDI